MKKIKLIALALILFGAINFLSACGLLLFGGLAGTTGYLAAKQGYGVQSPVTKK